MHSVMKYEEIAKANARQRVALEVLSFHASSSSEEAERVMVMSHVSCTLINCIFILVESIGCKRVAYR